MSQQSRAKTYSASQAGSLDDQQRRQANVSSTAPAQRDAKLGRADDDAGLDPGRQRRVENNAKGVPVERGAEAAPPQQDLNRPAQQRHHDDDLRGADKDQARLAGVRDKPDKALAGNMSAPQQQRQPDTTRQGSTNMQ